jgi:hypothetical protein
MPDDMQDLDSREEEVVSTDDRVIGRAFRWSLAVILGLAAVIALVIYLTRRPEEAAPEIAIETEAPVEVERPVAAPEVVFTDITSPAGIRFSHFNGAEGDKLLPESMGSGVAFFDFDNDLDPDLFLVNSTFWPHSQPAKPRPTSALYRNLGDGRFADASRETGLDITLYGTGVATGDYDGDGWVDLFVTAVGSNRLLRNDEGRFVDVDPLVGVSGDPGDWSTGAAFFDYDKDGDLDLFVCNYVHWSKEIDFEVDFRLTGVGRAYGPPFNYEGAFSYLYRNNGDGTFTDVSAESGIQVRNEATGVPVGKALGVLPIDVDLDGWIDILVANDTVQNFLFHNLGDGTFEEAGAYWGIAFGRNGEATGGMGVDAGYYRNDAELGFAIGNFANEMTSLYISQGDPTLFADEAIGEGVGAPTRTMLSFGVLFFDYDLDGRLDLLQSNGHLEGEINAVDPSQTYEQSSQLFWNAGPEQRQGFIPVATESTGDLATPVVGRGSAVADIDGDGDQDVVISQVARAPLLLRNDNELGHHWIRLKLVGDPPNPDALGARVELVAGGITQRRQVMPTRSYLSQSELTITFGLGKIDQVDKLRIYWPDGSEQQLSTIEIDRLTVVEKE